MKKSSLLRGLTAALTVLPGVYTSAQVVIPETFSKAANTADTAKPGFIWNVFQNQGEQSNNNTKTEDALAGRLVDADGNPFPNLANPDEVGGAAGPGQKIGTADNALIQFEVPTIINFNQDVATVGNIPDDLGIPGIPGLEGSTDGIAAEALTWLDLPVGDHTLIVNSDDGFRLTMGGAAPNDQFAVFVGEFNGGRGASDTTMNIRVTRAGLYATRLTWQEGGGGANVEFVQVKPGNVRVAVNSPDSTIKAYRATTGAAPTYASLVSPGPGSTTAPFDAEIAIDLVGAGVTTASVTLSLDGETVTPTVTKQGNVTSVRYKPSGRFAPRSAHRVVLGFNDGAAQTRSWNFTVVDYARLTADLKVTPDASKPGFIWNVHQNNAFQATDNTRPVNQLAGRLGENFADKDAVGIASGPGVPGANNRLPIRFEIPTVINLDQEGGSNGEFTPDDQMPGIPGLSEAGPTDGIAGEILTFIDLPAGVHTLIVNSDDGFFTVAGNVYDVFRRQQAGTFEGGRGAADTLYRIVVDEAGVYPFRTVWYEGGGGANIEWKIIKADGTRALINDTANGGPRAYRASTTGNPTAVTSVTPAPGSNRTAPDTNIELTIEEGTTPVDPATVHLMVDGMTVTPTVTKNGKTVSVVYNPATDFRPNSSHTAIIHFGSGAGARSESWTFTVPALTKDKVAGYPGFLVGASNYTPDGGGISGQAGDYGMDNGRSGAAGVYVANASFVNTAAADDTMTFAYWQKRYDIANSSGFWVNSPSSSGTSRGWQAHSPWSDGTIYFDTVGCCGGGDTRISRNISEFPGYTGDQTWWQDWHHFAFTKNGSTKRIYIDGELFHEGDNTNVLPDDFTDMWIGADGGGGNVNRGVLDEFVIYSGELSEADIQKLSTRSAAPSTISGLVAHWDFNDVPSPALALGLNFGADQPGASLAPTAAAGAAGVAQKNWNNLSGQAGTNSTLVVDVQGAAQPAPVTVTWGSNNTWASTGLGEENNKFSGSNSNLLVGYLDTANATTTSVRVRGIPDLISMEGYDVVVYTLGGVGGRGGGIRVIDSLTTNVLSDYIRVVSSTNPTTFAEATVVPGANPSGTRGYSTGNYIVFKGLTSTDITIQGTTAGGLGFSSTPRAPINAIQLVVPSRTSSGDRDVTRPGDLIVTSNTDARSPAAERVVNAIDNQLGTKYLNFGNDTDQSAPYVGPTGFTVTPSAGGSIVTGISLTSANDAPDRDPAAFKLEGSNDGGATFAPIAEGAVSAVPFSGRFTTQTVRFSNTKEYKTYRVTFTAIANATAANSMQVAEVELLGWVTSPASNVEDEITIARTATGLSITYAAGTTLESAPSVTGPWTAVAGAANPHVVSPTAAAAYYRSRR